LNFSASQAPATAPCWSSRPQVRKVFHSLRSVYFYGRGLADETLKALKAKGGKDVVFEGINPGEKDYSCRGRRRCSCP
jgi:branched-chain amino acid transport system substrate-binding protein